MKFVVCKAVECGLQCARGYLSQHACGATEDFGKPGNAFTIECESVMGMCVGIAECQRFYHSRRGIVDANTRIQRINLLQETSCKGIAKMTRKGSIDLFPLRPGNLQLMTQQEQSCGNCN
jgi:hypothetical protein